MHQPDKQVVVLAGIFSLAIGGYAEAVCTNGSHVTDPATVVGGNTVCATGIGPNTGDQWQEWHQGTTNTGGTLTEYAKGPADPVDPTHDVGTWRVELGNNTNQVRLEYNYGPGQVYQWYLHTVDDTNYTFCSARNNGTEVATATILPGQQGCGF